MDKKIKEPKSIIPILNRLVSLVFFVGSVYVGMDAYRLYRKWDQVKTISGHTEVRMLGNRFLLHKNVPNDMLVLYAGLILLLAGSLLFLCLNFLSDDINKGVQWLKDKLIPKRFKKKSQPVQPADEVDSVNSEAKQQEIDLELTTRFTLSLDAIEPETSENLQQGVLVRPKVVEDNETSFKETEAEALEPITSEALDNETIEIAETTPETEEVIKEAIQESEQVIETKDIQELAEEVMEAKEVQLLAENIEITETNDENVVIEENMTESKSDQE